MGYLSDPDREQVGEAVTAAEADTDGEIVTVIARRSDEYHDVAAHWAAAKLFGVLAFLTIFPSVAVWLYDHAAGPWADAPTPRALFTVALVMGTLVFLAAYFSLKWRPLRSLLTPPATKARRVRRRAIELFRTAAEARTRGKTGVLLYLSLEERRAELIADAAIHAKVAQEVWGDAMAALIVAVKAGRPGDGMAEAVRQVGVVLSEHFPRSDDDTNELPDRLIEL